MKNKLLVSVFAVGIATLAFTSCETKSNVTEVCTDLLNGSIHKSTRSLDQLEGETLTISEFEFPGDVNDNRLLFRTLTFGNGEYKAKKVDTMRYEYGEWQDKNTSFTLHVTPREGTPFQLVYRGNTLITAQGEIFGGEGTANTARVEKWEKTLRSFPNTAWEATYRAEFVMDSTFRDSVQWKPFPKPGRWDTIKVFDGMDTVSADTTCYCRFEVKRNAATNATTGHLYKKSVRSTYSRETKQTTILKQEEKEYDCNWYFSSVSSDSRFVITMHSTTPGMEGDVLNISKYKTDDAGEASEFLLDGLTYKRAVPNP